MLAPCGVDSQSADDGLGHRYGDLPLALADLDGAVGLIDDDRLEPFFVERRSFVTRTFCAAFRIAGSPGFELRGRGRLAITDVIFRRLQGGRRLQPDIAIARHCGASLRRNRAGERAMPARGESLRDAAPRAD